MFHFGNLGEYFWQPNVLFWLSNIANYLVLELFLIILIVLKKIKKKHFLFWSLYFLTPMIFNHIFFKPAYFGDQFRYVSWINEFKQGVYDIYQTGTRWQSFFSFRFIRSTTESLPTFIFSLFPMFSIATINSVAFINQFLCMGIYLLVKNKIPDTVAYLLLFCPSFVLYSSLSLRDTIVIFFSVLTLIFIIQKKRVFSLVCLIFCLLVKIQNAVGLAVVWGFSAIFKSYKHKLNLIIPFIMMLATLLILSPKIIPVFNFWRAAFLLENDMPVDLVMSLTQDVSIRSFLIYLVKAMLVYPFSPLPWQTNGFGLMMFFESVFLFGVYSVLFIKHFKFNFHYSLMFKTLCLGALVAAGVSAYVGVFANQGTMARYRFTGLFPYLIGSVYIYYKDKQLHEQF